MRENLEDCPEVLLAVEELGSWWTRNRREWAKKIAQVKGEKQK
jgi:hypothetical protein